MALKEKHQAFALAFIETWDKTKAAIKAGYSKQSARSIGHELYQRPDIQSEIRRLMKELYLNPFRLAKERIEVAMCPADEMKAKGIRYSDKDKYLRAIEKNMDVFTAGDDLPVDMEEVDAMTDSQLEAEYDRYTR